MYSNPRILGKVIQLRDALDSVQTAAGRLSGLPDCRIGQHGPFQLDGLNWKSPIGDTSIGDTPIGEPPIIGVTPIGDPPIEDP